MPVKVVEPIIPAPTASAESPAPAIARAKKTKPAKKPKRAKRQAPEGNTVGYCLPPVENRFPLNNPGGPGRRKKDGKSQDELMRAELSKTQMVSEGGVKRRRSKRELLTTLLVNASLEKRSPKELIQLYHVAGRLFPHHEPDTLPAAVIDHEADREYLRLAFAAIQIGEPVDGDTDPLAGLVRSVFDAEDNDEGFWDGADTTEDGEESDEAAQ